MKLTVKGPSRSTGSSDPKPLWEANVEIVKLSSPSTYRAVRSLFISRQTPKIKEGPSKGNPIVVDGKELLPPGTMIALCRVETARVNLGGNAYEWNDDALGSQNNPSLLLLQASPNGWSGISARLIPPDCTCIGGEIALDQLVRNPAKGDWQKHFQNVENADHVVLHGSGYSFEASAKLVWEDATIPAPFHVMLPFPEMPGTLRMTLDRERLLAQAANQFAAAFGRLANALQPNLPNRPRWVSLELSTNTDGNAAANAGVDATVPKFYWDVMPNTTGGTATFRLERDEMQLLVSDQALGGAVPARGVCRTVPEEVSINLTSNLELLLTVESGGVKIPFVASDGDQQSALPAELQKRLEIQRQNGAGVIVWTGAGVTTAEAAALTTLKTNTVFSQSFLSAVDQLLTELQTPASGYRYDAAKTGNTWSENVRLTEIASAYDPLTTANLLRQQNKLPTPDPTTAEKISPTVMWGFAPLEDGWAQLPFLNLTEQIYLDALEPQPEVEQDILLSGAASIGNDTPDLLSLESGGQPWSVTLLNAGRYTGQWRLTRAGLGQPWQPQSVGLSFFQPEVVLNGFLWLATERPSAADALPSLDNWLDGLRMVSLHSLRPGEMFPAPFVLRFSQLNFSHTLMGTTAKPISYPSLQQWDYIYQANQQNYQGRTATPVFQKLVNEGPWKEKEIWSDLPLVWRRHPALPAIQALPLTQNQTPPNYPSPSRQLVPFELPVQTASGAPPATLAMPAGWKFGVGVNGAKAWPQLINAQMPPPAREWKDAQALWLASLSVPGLIFDPNRFVASSQPLGTFLPAQYQFGLPYTDELNALAQLPKETKANRPDDGTVSEPPVLALQRATFKQYWGALAERAFLARPDADDALALSTSGAQIVVRGLIEPFDWPVTVALNETAYPGSIVIGETGKTQELKTATALRGIEGNFTNDGNTLKLDSTATPKFSVVSGSMLAQSSGGQMRDQRGLKRRSTLPAAQASTSKILKTQVQPENGAVVELCSLLEPLAMTIKTGGADQQWRLWFRDVPVTSDLFDRATTRSNQARGVNDPAANSRDFVHLTGYEWRLAEQQTSTSVPAAFLPLLSFHFYPQTLEKVQMDGDNIAAVELTGRLQLPAVKPAEQTDLNNVVRVRFERGAAGLALMTIVAAAPESDPGTTTPVPAIPIEWPLSEDGSAATLRWQTITYTPATGNVVIPDARLEFSLFDARWTLPAKALTFAATGQTATLNYGSADLGTPAESAITIQQVNLTLSLANPALNDLAVNLAFRWGAESALRLQVIAMLHLFGSSPTTFNVFLEREPVSIPPTNGSPQPVPLDSAPQATLSLLPAAIQIRFSDSAPNLRTARQMLPGMHLSPNEGIKGFAAMSFSVVGQANNLPRLSVRAGFTEVMLPCEWGQQLQEAGLSAAPEMGRVFGSSAGRLYGGYTLRASRDNAKNLVWTPSLMLNGFLEIKNLISWPKFTPTQGTSFVLPAVRPAGATAPALNHVRHTMRVLFNQHEVPVGVLKAGTDKLLLDFEQSKAWQLLAVVEHQLIDVQLSDSTKPLAVSAVNNDRRWTAVQEVRLFHPSRFTALLNGLLNGPNGQKFGTGDPEKELAAKETTAKNAPDVIRMLISELKDVNRGYQREGLINLLANTKRGATDDNELGRLSGTLLVEASAPHWIRVQENTAGQFASVQYLPRGTQRAILSIPEDFASRDKTPPPWLLLALPFLGRLQAQPNDKLDATSVADTDSLLQLDPIIYIDRQRRLASPPLDMQKLPLAFASWDDKADTTFIISEFDLSDRRRFGRLDPATLEESWFRLQNPPDERAGSQSGSQLPSVLAALPTDSPGRLSRPAILKRLFDSYRNALPPRAPRQSDPQPEDIGVDQDLLWRRNNLFVIQGVSNLSKNQYGFHFTGAQIQTSGLQVANGRITRHSSATMIPAVLQVGDIQNPEPVSFAASPYLGLEYQDLSASGGQQGRLRLTVAELLCLDPTGLDLGSVASQIWAESEGTPQNIQTWGIEVHQRLAADSPIAVVRVRQVREVTATSTTPAGVTVEYQFHVLSVQPPISPARRTRRVRVRLEGLRFAEGQYGGNRLPGTMANFELAPPQTCGVQPLYLQNRPAETPPNPAAREWPWGLSALRFSVQHTDGKTGLAGKIFASDSDRVRLWWNANRHEVQFALPSDASAKRLLPRLFRAKAISSLLPAVPNVPLPSGADLKMATGETSTLDAKLKRWQPLLPGSFRTLIDGARAGVPFVFNYHLLCQETSTNGAAGTDAVFASGSVPVQHRMPRPPLLPANRADATASALRPWASFFDSTTNSRVTSEPIDNAFVAGDPPIGLDMRLVNPGGGAIPQGGGKDLFFELIQRGGTAGAQPLGIWTINVELVVGSRRIVYQAPTQAETDGMYKFTAMDSGVSNLLGGLPHGAQVIATAKVERKQGGTIKGYQQTLSFPLRIARATELALPLQPKYVQFEDPEYNRQLASISARDSRFVSQSEKRFEVILAADRREYNATSQLFTVFYGDPVPNANRGRLKIEWLDATGVRRTVIETVPNTDLTFRALSVFDLGKLAADRGFVFTSGDSLLLTLSLLDDNTKQVLVVASVTVQIVAKPVQPAPAAGYAMLRKQGDAVACARFAWSPQPSRIELIDPDDLTRELVRRRAVFQWTDSARTARPSEYAIQKIAPSGATHFPFITG